jgi:leucyl/phenylalanyl-tRNA---protein transferase
MQNLSLRRLRPEDPPEAFPDPARALREPDGLLAVGGDLSPERLLYAYRHGIFPWYDTGLPILWWSPDPRAMIQPDSLHVSRSLHRRMRRGGYTIRFDTAFVRVMEACAHLHELGHAHCAEMWQDGELVGGLYGVAVGQVFFGESMFSRVADASKIVLVTLMQHLERWNYAFMDCQVQSEHLESLGSIPVPRQEFLKMLATLCTESAGSDAWRPET